MTVIKDLPKDLPIKDAGEDDDQGDGTAPSEIKVAEEQPKMVQENAASNVTGIQPTVNNVANVNAIKGNSATPTGVKNSTTIQNSNVQKIVDGQAQSIPVMVQGSQNVQMTSTPLVQSVLPQQVAVSNNNVQNANVVSNSNVAAPVVPKLEG